MTAGTGGEAAVVAEGLVKRFGDTTALDGVSFTVNAGELFGFIGPDGAGKTTLFRILATLLVPDAGTARVLGHDAVAELWAIRPRVGYMPGRFALYADLSVEENLRFFASVFGTTIEREYERIAPIYSQLEPFRDRRAGALSGGMKQKLALCCALVHRPEILLLDEPTTGVDAVSRREFWDLLERLKASGLTIVVSTPYLDEARRCDRAAFFQDGRILAIDTPAAITRMFGTHPAPRPRADVTAEPAIRVRELTRRFGTFTAVDRISFEVRAGEVFGFLGANGAGKTTAIRMLTGLLLPSGGAATIAGHDVYTESEAIKRAIGYMSQRFSLYEDLTVRENIRLYGGIYGLSNGEIRDRTARLLSRLGLEHAADELVRAIPLGWRQKLAFSVALLHEPRIVFLDEPTSGVDPITRRQFWELIYEAAAAGTTVLVTTHYMDEAEYCDRISIMVAGRIDALGTPDELKREFGVDSIDELFVRLARPAGSGV